MILQFICEGILGLMILVLLCQVCWTCWLMATRDAIYSKIDGLNPGKGFVKTYIEVCGITLLLFKTIGRRSNNIVGNYVVNDINKILDEEVPEEVLEEEKPKEEESGIIFKPILDDEEPKVVIKTSTKEILEDEKKQFRKQHA